ncbi:hypothetical protein EsHS_00007028 [Epichloe bromicola]
MHRTALNCTDHISAGRVDNLLGSSGLARRLNTTVILASNSAQHFPGADHIVVLGDNGVIDQGSWQNIKVKAASIAKFSSDNYAKDITMLSTNFDKLAAQLRAKDETEQDLARQSGDPALYAYYLGFIDAMNIFLLLATTMSYGFFVTIPQYWLKLWTESGDKSTAFYVGGFLVLSTMSWVSTSAQMCAPLSFFSVTDNGSILNRFSQDIRLIDKQLPPALQSIVTQMSKLVMQIILLCVAERWLAASLPVCMLLVYVVQKVYLRTSRQLRFLELEARAEVFSSFLETIEGIETIRSFGWSAAVIQNNIHSVDNAQRPEFLLLCSQRWLNIVLDLLASAIATSVVLIAIVLRGQVSGAQVGIALNIMLVANTTLLKLVENWTTLEISLGAISRVKHLEKTTPTEGGPAKSSETPQNWPSAGHIVFRDVSASYQSESVALRNLSLTVAAGQKLVVCGRTGSGKSTLLLTLLRLLELRSGYIELDGIDIGQVNLDLLRQRCFIAVSQDPLLLFNETLRFNLDPDASESESILIDALAKVRLMSHFFDARTHLLGEEMATVINMADSTEHPILDQKLSSFAHLSVGQCQLFALCRALVKARSSQRLGLKPVVVLDEVTSSLDTVTESAIYKIIDEEFTEGGHTVIIVAHRLGVLEKHMRSGRDAVVFMADGKLEEVVQDFEITKFRASDK